MFYGRDHYHNGIHYNHALIYHQVQSNKIVKFIILDIKCVMFSCISLGLYTNSKNQFINQKISVFVCFSYKIWLFCYIYKLNVPTLV